MTVVVTRPGAAGQALTSALVAAGQPALWLPAFQFGPAPEPDRARATLALLSTFDLAIFVSPQAVRATAELLPGQWPAQTRIAAVGAATRVAVLDAIAGADSAAVIAPEGDNDTEASGSEALWRALQSLPLPPQRVLLLRAQSGRDWLGQRLQSLGAQVEALATYARVATVPDADLREALDKAASAPMASVISSSDAVAALQRMLAPQPPVWQALLAGPALAAHPRIATGLRAAGFARISICALTARAVLQALRKA